MSSVLSRGLVRASFRRAAAVVLCLAAAAVAFESDAGVRWRSGAASVERTMAAGELEAAMAELAARPEQKRVVVRFDGPVGPAEREELVSSGVRLLGYLGDHAYFATLEQRLDADRASKVRGMVQVEGVQPEAKMHPDVARGVVYDWAIIRPPGKQAPPQADPLVAVYVLFHRDFDLEGAPRILAGHGATVGSEFASVNGIVAHVPASRMRGLANEDDVMWVEPPLPQMTGLNDSNRVLVQANELQEAPYGLDGTGVTVLVYDAGKMFQHDDFGDRLTIGLSDTDGISDHATHVGGTIGGDGSGQGGQYRGMAPNVDLISYAFEQEGGLQQGFLYTDPGDIEADYSEAMQLYGVDISNNSIGSNTAPNGFPCEWEGNYGATGALIDAIARGSLGAPFRIVWANGNERSSGACGTTYLTTAPPACAKNHITVGALNSNNDSVTSFTSWGPTDDGRLKPDISGPGCQSDGDSGVTSTNSSGGYNTKCGTSMASPTVCGVGALILQQYRQSFPGEPDPRNATLKSILATTATEIHTPGPDYQSGYGSVRGIPAVDLVAEGRFLEAEVAQDEVYSFLILVGPDDDELKITIAWDDVPGTPNVNPVLVNDLDLRVLDGGGGVHHPWTLDPVNPADPAIRTQRDGVNNIEQVVIDNPTPGVYRVEVTGFNIADGPTQTFGVAASPSLIKCSSSGVLAVSPGRVACDGELDIQVIDCDLNTDDGVIETVSVSVVSGSEPGGETVVLTESAPESAAFGGTLPVSTTDDLGVILISEGETISVTYVDADDGQGATDVDVVRDVVVDCSSPQVVSVQVTDVQPRSATAAVTLDEASRVTAHIGTTCGAPTSSVSSSSLNTNHDLRFGGLLDDTAYFFTVDAVDEAGNAASFDNAGECYTFTTPEIPDFFTEQFSGGIDLEGLSITFTPNGSPDFYAMCVEDLAGGLLPTDPTGGTDSGLGDDQPTSFGLTGGATVSLYGVSYATVHVGPNGYLTLDAGDSDYTETLADHFDQPRISAMFDDLNPGSAGSVSWLQLTDRVAVTWQDVPEYSTSNSNTFQIELFFDGRIRLSYVDVDSSDALAGLSSGAGLDPDFFESDLSSGLSCGASPPTALSVARVGLKDLPMVVALTASDDGLPEPGLLTYRITSLPSSGTLTHEDSGTPIGAVPYDLPAGGTSIRYTPHYGFEGEDSFTFVGDDGGAPPEGGVSNEAQVTITVTGFVTHYDFLVNDMNPGWTTTGDWAFGQPSGGGSNGGDPTSGATGQNVYGYNLSGDYDNGMLGEHLTSGPMDFSSISGAMLEFSRWLGVADGDRAKIQLSTDGGTLWTDVWSHTTGVIDETVWSQQSYDISALADGESSVTLRWTMGRTNDAVTYPGWNIDDVQILASTSVSCSAAPGEAQNLLFGADTETLSWNAPALIGGISPRYDVLRTDSSSDFAGAFCLESDGPDTLASDGDTPLDGDLYFYLVRPENDCGEGPLGAGRSGPVCLP